MVKCSIVIIVILLSSIYNAYGSDGKWDPYDANDYGPKNKVLSPGTDDWRSGLYVVYTTDSPNGKIINSPFWENYAPLTIQFGIDSDFDPEQGWNLLYCDFGVKTTPMNLKNSYSNVPGPIQAPFFVLYNKYRGILRVFFYIDSSIQQNMSYGTIKMTINNVTTSMFAMNYKYMKSISNEDRIMLSNTNNTGLTPAERDKWIYADFLIAYDPIVKTLNPNNNNYNIGFEFHGFEEAILDATMKPDYSNFNDNGSGRDGNGNFNLGSISSTAIKSYKQGQQWQNDITKFIDSDDAKKIFNKMYPPDGTASNIDPNENFESSRQGFRDSMSNKNFPLHGLVSSFSKLIPYGNVIASMLGLYSGGGGANSNQTMIMPDFTIKGTLKTEFNVTSYTIPLPGVNYPVGSTALNNLIYNKSLGVFCQDNVPTALCYQYQLTDPDDPNAYDYFTDGYVIELPSFTGLKINEDSGLKVISHEYALGIEVNENSMSHLMKDYYYNNNRNVFKGFHGKWSEETHAIDTRELFITKFLPADANLSRKIILVGDSQSSDFYRRSLIREYASYIPNNLVLKGTVMLIDTNKPELPPIVNTYSIKLKTSVQGNKKVNLIPKWPDYQLLNDSPMLCTNMIVLHTMKSDLCQSDIFYYQSEPIRFMYKLDRKTNITLKIKQKKSDGSFDTIYTIYENKEIDSGFHEYYWNGQLDSGKTIQSGVYAFDIEVTTEDLKKTGNYVIISYKKEFQLLSNSYMYHLPLLEDISNLMAMKGKYYRPGNINTLKYIIRNVDSYPEYNVNNDLSIKWKLWYMKNGEKNYLTSQNGLIGESVDVLMPESGENATIFVEVTLSNSSGAVTRVFTLKNMYLKSPQDLIALHQNSSVILQWSDNSVGESKYKIFKKINNNNFDLLGTVEGDTISFTDIVELGNIYSYFIQPIEDSCEPILYPSNDPNNISNIVTINTVTKPTTPGFLSAVYAQINTAKGIYLKWRDNATNETRYEVYRSTNGSNYNKIATLPLDATNYFDSSTNYNVLYYYKVCAYNENANKYSEFSNVASRKYTTMDQPIHLQTIIEENFEDMGLQFKNVTGIPEVSKAKVENTMSISSKVKILRHFVIKSQGDFNIQICNNYGTKAVLIEYKNGMWKTCDFSKNIFEIKHAGEYVICDDVSNVFIPKIHESKLLQNKPNPFNPETDIPYTVAKSSIVILKVYNAKGKEIITLVNEFKEAGSYQVHWDGKDYRGNDMPSGVYYSIFEVDGKRAVKKMIMLK